MEIAYEYRMKTLFVHSELCDLLALNTGMFFGMWARKPVRIKLLLWSWQPDFTPSAAISSCLAFHPFLGEELEMQLRQRSG